MIMKQLRLFFYFVGSFIQLEMSFGIYLILLYNVINQCKICKIKKPDWRSVTAVLTPDPRWTFMDSWARKARLDAWDESVSTGCLTKPIMNARDTANVIQNL